jgi:hypothetical protein
MGGKDRATIDSTKGYTPKTTKEPVVDNVIVERIEQLEARISQLEITLKNSVTFETLAARIIGNPENKKVRKVRAKREFTPEQKAAFHAKMVAGRLAKEKARLAASKK